MCVYPLVSVFVSRQADETQMGELHVAGQTLLGVPAHCPAVRHLHHGEPDCPAGQDCQVNAELLSLSFPHPSVLWNSLLLPSPLILCPIPIHMSCRILFHHLQLPSPLILSP